MSADRSDQASLDPAATPAPAWLLTGRTLPVSTPVAPELRLARMEAWLADLGFRPIVFRAGRRGGDRRITTGGWRHALRGLLLTPRLGYLALRERPRVVLTNSPTQAPAVALVKLLLRSRVYAIADVIGLQSIEVEQATPARWLRLVNRPVLRALESLLFRSVDLVLTVNDRHAELVRARAPHARIRTLRDTADPDLAARPPADRDALGIPTDGITVAFVGSLVYSRLEPAFAAWSELEHDAEQPFRLVVIGDGPDLRPYARRAAEQGWLWRSVFFLGALPHGEAAAAVAACDIAYSECWSDAGFPAKLYEYMALGKPIVVEGKPQLREVLADGRDACFFRTPDELASALRRLGADRALRERLGHAGRETFLSSHTPVTRGQQFTRALSPVVSPGSPPAVATPPDEHGGPEAGAPPPRATPALVSVVVPVLNASGVLRRQLDALGQQDYDGAWELLVVDNGSEDGSPEIAREWISGRSNARLVEASGANGAAHARNRGVAAAAGDFVAFCDADDMVTERWLTELTGAATRADVVGGSLSVTALNTAHVRTWRRSPSQLGLLVGHGFMRFASGNNCGIWKEAFQRLGGFDERMMAGEDIDLSWRAQLAGYRLSFAHRASVEIAERPDLRSLARQQYRYGVSSGQLFRRYGTAGMARPSLLHAAGTWAWLLLALVPALRTGGGRGRWVATAALRCGRLAGSIRYRVAVL